MDSEPSHSVQYTTPPYDTKSTHQENEPNTLTLGPAHANVNTGNAGTRYPTSPLTHILILTSVLGPVTLVPYLAVRRHLLRLHTQLVKMNDTHVTLKQDLRAAILEMNVRRMEQERVDGLMEGLRKEMEVIKRRVERTVMEGDLVGREVRRLVEEREKEDARWPDSTLRELGKSLADVAAFMHEVEIQQGFVARPNDGRGIEQIRQLAYKLETSLKCKAGESSRSRSRIESKDMKL